MQRDRRGPWEPRARLDDRRSSRRARDGCSRRDAAGPRTTSRVRKYRLNLEFLMDTVDADGKVVSKEVIKCGRKPPAPA